MGVRTWTEWQIRLYLCNIGIYSPPSTWYGTHAFSLRVPSERGTQRWKSRPQYVWWSQIFTDIFFRWRVVSLCWLVLVVLTLKPQNTSNTPHQSHHKASHKSYTTSSHHTNHIHTVSQSVTPIIHSAIHIHHNTQYHKATLHSSQCSTTNTPNSRWDETRPDPVCLALEMGGCVMWTDWLFFATDFILFPPNYLFFPPRFARKAIT